MTGQLSPYINTARTSGPSISWCPRAAIWDQAGTPGPPSTVCRTRNLQHLDPLQRGSEAPSEVLGCCVLLLLLPVTLGYLHLSAHAQVLSIKARPLPQIAQEVWLTKKLHPFWFHCSLFFFFVHFLSAHFLQPQLDYACQLGLVMLMTNRYTEITLISNRICKALAVISTLLSCNGSHVQKDTFSLPTSAKKHFTDFLEAKLNLAE